MSGAQPENRTTNRGFMLTLALGILTGFSFAIVLSTPKEFWNNAAWQAWRESVDKIDPKKSNHLFNRKYAIKKDSSIAIELSKKVRVLCWVMTAPYNHWKARYIKVTWGRRCNKVLFMSTQDDPAIQSIKLPVPEGRDYLWAKTKAAFKYVYENHRSEADWFLKADDDTYVIMENLRYLLSAYDSNEPLYFGCWFKSFAPDGNGFMSGGAGYVLSYAALRLLVTKGLKNPKICWTSLTGIEDTELGRCMDRLGITPVDTRDSMERGRFFPLPPLAHFFPLKGVNDWYWEYIYHNIKKGPGCCSDYAVTFHYVGGQEMVILEYFLYNLHVYGIKFGKGDTVPTDGYQWNDNNDDNLES